MLSRSTGTASLPRAALNAWWPSAMTGRPASARPAEDSCRSHTIRSQDITSQVAWRAATLMQEYHRSHSGTGLGDCLIAATALTEGLELATLNVRHYPMFPELARPF
jgi:predicted nucleic acid-binding protein